MRKNYLHFLQTPHSAKHKLTISNKALQWLEKNFTKSINLHMTADAIGVSVSSLCTALRDGTGKSWQQHLLEMRLSEAKQLLIEECDSIGTISLRCGFYDQSHFCRAFKKAFSISPRKFRNYANL